MGFRFRKSVNLGGGFRTTFSKSGVGFSWGMKGFRVKKAGGGTRTTFSIPGTGISHVSDKSGGSGCITNLIVWPLKLCLWMIYDIFWLMWQMCYWTVKLCFILPIKYLIPVFQKQNKKPMKNKYKIKIKHFPLFAYCATSSMWLLLPPASLELLCASYSYNSSSKVV